jgi:hypothetical protein
MRRKRPPQNALFLYITGSYSRGWTLAKVMRMKIAGMWLELVSYKAKLIVISGCYALIGKSAKYFNKTFPNAAMLGFVGSSPKRKGAFYEKYLDSLPSTLDVD